MRCGKQKEQGNIITEYRNHLPRGINDISFRHSLAVIRRSDTDYYAGRQERSDATGDACICGTHRGSGILYLPHLPMPILHKKKPLRTLSARA